MLESICTRAPTQKPHIKATYLSHIHIVMISITRRVAPLYVSRSLKAVSFRVMSTHDTRWPSPLACNHRGNSARHEQPRRSITTFKQRCALKPQVLYKSSERFIQASDITTQEYHQASDTTMEALFDSLENLLDQRMDLPYEVDYSVSASAPVVLVLARTNGAFLI